MTIEQALTLVRSAGYRVSKPQVRTAKIDRTRAGPTCVAVFPDGEICRMSTHTSRTQLDWNRGTVLCKAAYGSRKQLPALMVPEPIDIWFEEQDGTVISDAQAKAA